MDDSDPNKAQKLAQLNNLKDQKSTLEKERNNTQGKIDDRSAKLDKFFQDMGDPVKYSPQQYTAKANTPHWKSWKNWGIGIAAVLILFILIGFIRKLFDMLLKTVKG